MTDKIILRMIKMSPFLLLTLVIMACGPTPTLPEPNETTMEDAIAQTMEARDALALQVQQTVDAQMAALQPIAEVPAEVPAGGDVADPNANIPVSQPVVDPNLAGGTPQLRVTLSSVNVRSGPGTNFPPITTLRQDAVVVASAKNQTGTWFLIDLPGGAKGWISNTVTTPVVEADMIKVAIAATIPSPPVAAVRATATGAPTTAAVASPTKAATTAAATHTPKATTAAPTATATTPAPATMPPMPTATATEPPMVISVVIGVQNDSGIEICFVFIDLSSDPWSNDRLGPSETIADGSQASFGGFPAGMYDLMAQDCNGDVINSMANVQVNSGFTWVVQ